MDVTVVIASYGQGPYRELALKRAQPSAIHQATEVVTVHFDGGTLAQVRNHGLAQVRTEWVCFLDADDELEPGYLEAMERGTADVRAPAVRYVPWSADLSNHLHARARPAPRMPRVAGHHHDCTADCLAYGNWLVIGSVARTELVREVGGFNEWPCYEDWDLWARCWQHGATFEALPEAVYRAHVRSTSRNRGTLTQRQKHRVHQDIARDLGLPVPT